MYEAINFSVLYISLSIIVLNSKDRQEETWHPTFLHLHNTPHNIQETECIGKML